MSLAAVSRRLATEPYTNDAAICAFSGSKAARNGSASPTVLRAMLRNSRNNGDFGFARVVLLRARTMHGHQPALLQPRDFPLHGAGARPYELDRYRARLRRDFRGRYRVQRRP